MPHFNPRSPCGERQLRTAFQIQKFYISIHAPRAGSDGNLRLHCPLHCQISIHAPRAGSDPSLLLVQGGLTHISIHAPRAGSDCPDPFCLLRVVLFQSTLPVRGATADSLGAAHGDSYFNPRSPCGERPAPRKLRLSRTPDFNPRSPCGERRLQISWLVHPFHFNPRSPCGERQVADLSEWWWGQFQSTLPVRGATGHECERGLESKRLFQSTLPVRGATAKMPKTEPFILSNFHNFKKYTDRTRTKVIIKMELWINLSPLSGANRTGNLWSLLLRTLKGS